MANSFKISQATLNAANTDVIALRGVASTTLVKGVYFIHEDHNSNVKLSLEKSGGTKTVIREVSHLAGDMTQLLPDTTALEAGDILYVQSDHISSVDLGYVVVNYVESTESVAGQSIGVLTDVDLTGLSDGDALVYNSISGDFEPGAAGGSVDALNDIGDVNASSPQDNNVISWDNATSKWIADGRLTTLYAELKEGTSTTLTDGANTNSQMELTGTTARLKTGVTEVKMTETSPGEIDFVVAAGASGSETAFTAVEINGTTTANNALVDVKDGARLRLESGTNNFATVRNTASADTVITLPASNGTLALQSELPAASPWTTSGSDIYYNTGNVGIGTATPAQALHVSGTDKHIYIEDGNLKLDRANEGRIEFGIAGQMWGASNGNAVYLQKVGASSHRFDFITQGGTFTVRNTADSTDYFTVTSEEFQSYSGSQFKYVQHNAANNNNGVVLQYNNGTASAGNRGLVQVNGDLKVNDYTTGSAVEKIKLGNDGKITVTHGSAAISINGTAEQQGVAIGPSSKASIRSVVIGYEAGRFQGTVDPDNVFIGHSAGRLATSNSSVYVGKEAGEDNDGDQNVAIGYQALEATGSTASNTVAVGYQALTALTTGVGNTAVGYQAGDGITTAGYNTVVGYSADVGTSNSGTVMGYQASGAGSRVVSIGYQVQGGVVTNGWQNVGIGYQANYQGASENNVSIGALAGYSGNVRSVSIGSGAGYSGADYGVFIGYNAGYNETGSNKLYIENSNSTTPLIYGEFDNDFVRINGDLEVTGDIDLSGDATRNLLVGPNQYVFQYTVNGTSTLYGLYFNLSNTSYDLTNGSGDAMLSVDANNGNTKVHGVLQAEMGVEQDEANLTTDGAYGAGAEITYLGASTTAVSAGRLYYYDGTTWTAYTSATEAPQKALLGIAAGGTMAKGFVLKGFVNPDSSTLTAGAQVFGATNASLTSTAPTSGYQRILGHAISTSVMYFNPSQEYIELA